MVAQILVNGIIAGLAYGLFALGFGLAYNTTRIFNFAHGAVYTLAAYSFYTCYVILAVGPYCPRQFCRRVSPPRLALLWTSWFFVR